jgi:small-conductance mechanosensitive channel
MKNVTPPSERPRPARTTPQRPPVGNRGAFALAGAALLPFVLIGLAVVGVALAVGLIWAAAWAVLIAVFGAFAVAGVVGAAALLRAQRTRTPRHPG